MAFIQVTDKSAMSGPLWLVRKDGTQAHQVQGLPGPVMADKFSWSPTANVMSVSTEEGLWLLSTEGAPQRLVKTSGKFPNFTWSPDGKTIAYNDTIAAKEPGNMDDVLLTVAVNGGKPVNHLQTPGTGIQLAGWQKDGAGLLFWLIPAHGQSIAADGVDLYKLQLGETDPKPKPITSGLTYNEWLSFSPQGQLLMVAGGGRIAWADKSLVLVNLKTGQLEPLQNPNGCVTIDPQFSPDGKKITFVAAKNLGNDVWGFENLDSLNAWVNSRTLYVANADGSNVQALPTAGQGIYQPSWSKDGRHILYVKDNALWSIKAEGGEPERIFGPVFDQQDPLGFYGFASYQNVLSWYKG
ncbi:biopolymer transporter Tol [Peptococcaceae bacterium 1198_IL3148]